MTTTVLGVLHDPPSAVRVGRGCGSVLPGPGQRISGDVQHPAAVALPRRQLPNHHNQRGDAIDKHGEPDEHDQLKRAEYDHFHEPRGYIGTDYFATADDGTRVIEFVDVDPATVRVFYHGGAYHLVADVAVDSAGDGVSGPADNTLRRLPDTGDGDLWRLLRRVLDPADPGYAYVDARDELLHAIAARYGDH